MRARPSRSRLRPMALLPFVAIALCLLALLGQRTSEAARPPKKDMGKRVKPKPEPEAAPEPPKAPAGPEMVDVGVYLHHIPTIDLKTNTYLADFYLWFRWKGEHDPTKSFEFTNAVETWDLHRQATYVDDDGNPKSEDVEGGAKYQVFHVQGRFLNPFRLQNYPFDEQDIVIRFEDAESQIDKMRYRVDEGGAKHHPGVEIPGWDLTESSAEVRIERYPSNFGDPRVAKTGDAYTQFVYTLHIVRPVKGYLIKTLLPIAIVVAIAFVVFLIPLHYFDGRLGLAITNLISAVALQLSTSSDLPSVGYLVLLDKIYNLAYLVIFGSLVESVLVTRLYDSDRKALARRIDRWSALVLFLLITTGLAFILRLK